MHLATTIGNVFVRDGFQWLRPLSRQVATACLIGSFAVIAGHPAVCRANGGSMGGRSSGGSMSRGASSVGRGLGNSGTHVGGSPGLRTSNLGRVHGGGYAGGGPVMQVTPQTTNVSSVQSHPKMFTPYFRTDPNSPWMPIGSYRNPADAARAQQMMKGFGYDSFMQGR